MTILFVWKGIYVNMRSLQSSVLISIAYLGLLGAVRVKESQSFIRLSRQGRVGMLQDRLVKEVRLRNISSIKEANLYLGEEFIEVHNKQFGKATKGPQNGHGPLNPKEDLEKILAIRSEGCTSKSLSIRYNNQIYQLQTETPNRLRYKKVIEKPGKPLVVELQGKEICYTVWEEYQCGGSEIVDDKQLEARGKKKCI